MLTLGMIFRMCVTTLHVQCRGKRGKKKQRVLGEKAAEGQIYPGGSWLDFNIE